MRERLLIRWFFTLVVFFHPTTPSLHAADAGSQVKIEFPEANTIIASSAIHVSGTAVARSRDIGIVINGVVAEIDLDHSGTIHDPYRWFAAIDADPGRVKLKARLKTPETEDRDEDEGSSETDGSGPASVRFVDFAPSKHYARIKASPGTGLAPLAVRFDLDSVLTGDVALFEIDYDGDGHFDLTAPAIPMTFHSRTTLRVCVS